MPSGAKKRKAAKKKKVNNNGSSTTNPNQGENDSGELNSPTSQDPLVEVVKKEDDSSENKLKDINEEEGNIEVEIVSKSKSSNGSSSSNSSDSSDDESNIVEKKVVVHESVPVIESLPEENSPIVEPVIKPVDSLLEQVSQVFDEIKDERKGFVVEETKVVVEEQQQQQTVGSEIDCPSSSEVVESVLKENEVETLPLSDEKASLVSKECVESSTPPKDSISEVKGADCANEGDTVEHSDRQAQVASTPLSVQKTTSWKSCCGIFELFTGSQR